MKKECKFDTPRHLDTSPPWKIIQKKIIPEVDFQTPRIYPLKGYTL